MKGNLEKNMTPQDIPKLVDDIMTEAIAMKRQQIQPKLSLASSP